MNQRGQEGTRQENAGGDFLTRLEVAGILRVTTKTVSRMTKAGVLPSLSIGRLVRYRRDDVLAAMEAFRNS